VAHAPEVIDRPHEAATEEPMPDAVHPDAKRERVLEAREAPCEREPAAPRERGEIEIVRISDRAEIAARDHLSSRARVAADVDGLVLAVAIEERQRADRRRDLPLDRGLRLEESSHSLAKHVRKLLRARSLREELRACDEPVDQPGGVARLVGRRTHESSRRKVIERAAKRRFDRASGALDGRGRSQAVQSHERIEYAPVHLEGVPGLVLRETHLEKREVAALRGELDVDAMADVVADRVRDPAYLALRVREVLPDDAVER